MSRPLDAQAREHALFDRRCHYRTLSDRDLANVLNTIAREPRRLTPVDRQAAIMTAAGRLWAADGPGRAEERTQ